MKQTNKNKPMSDFIIPENNFMSSGGLSKPTADFDKALKALEGYLVSEVQKQVMLSEPCHHVRLSGGKHCPKCFEALEPLKDELELQKECKLYFDQLFPDLILVHHQNNQTNKVAGMKSKALGVRKGMPDFQVLTDGAKSFFIEMKFGNGRLSTEQKNMHAQLHKMGFQVFESRTLKDFINIITCHVKKR